METIKLNTQYDSLTLVQRDACFDFYDGPDNLLLTYLEEDGEYRFARHAQIEMSDEELYAILQPYLKSYLEAGRIGVEYDGSEDGSTEISHEDDPFNPEDISIDTKGIAMDTLLRRLEQKTILLNPDFQRKEVWNVERKSQLIESLILKIPIPMFYVSCDEKGVWTVVDGLQRLSTIRDFVLGKKYLENPRENANYKGVGLKLKGLEFWNDLEGKCLNELPQNLYNRILETEFKFTIINPGTPEEVKRNVFKRLNTGGMPLSGQEIRNALYTGKVTDLLTRLASLDVFKEATCRSIHSERMEDKELILRFVAFCIRDYTTYTKNQNIDTWLSDTMIIFNALPGLDSREFQKSLRSGTIIPEHILKLEVDVIEKRFVLAMERSKALFGAHAFRKSYAGKKKTPINKSLFETWAVILSKLSESEFEVLESNREAFLAEYKPLIDRTEFIIEISRDSMKHLAVKSRFEKLNNLVSKYLNVL